MAILHFSQLKKWKSSSKKFLLYKTNRCQVETKEIILVLELYRMATEALKSQLTFYAGNAVQNGKGVLIRLPSQKSNYKMGNENNKVAEKGKWV